MKKFINFIIILNKKIKKDNIAGLSNELTYKIILSIFPFLTFLMSLLGFINIKIDELIPELSNIMPQQFLGIFNAFIQEVFYEQHASIMSISILLSIYSASSGFGAVIKGINRSYEQEEKRNFIIVQLISIFLVFLFAVAIISSVVLSISSEFIANALQSYQIFGVQFINVFKILKYVALFTILFFTVIFIYKFSCCKKIKFKNIIPGVLFTTVLWVTSSKLYSIYIENFSNYSKIYGSIGSIFILLVWLNMISTFLLIGSEINSLLEK